MQTPIPLRSTKYMLRHLGACTLVLMMSACGGGGGGGSPTPTSAPASSSPVMSSSSSSISSSSTSSVASSFSSLSSLPASSSAASFAPLELDSPDALSQAIHFDGGYSLKADVPAPVDPTGGSITINPEVAITAGGSTQFDLAAEVPEGMHVHAYLIQIEGSETSFVIPVNAEGQPYSQASVALAASEKVAQLRMQKSVGQADDPRTQLSCNGYPNLTFTAGAATETPYYEAPAKVYAYVQADMPPLQPPVYLIPSMSRERENWTTPATIKMKAVKVGSGKLQITLTWDSEADVDLHLEEPDGNTIYFGNDTSVAGDGFLDVDDTDGFGPENIFYEADVPAGEYTVRVNLFDVSALTDLPTSYTVKVKRNNVSEVFNGSLATLDETDDITSFTMTANGGTGSGPTTGPGSKAPGSYPTKPNTLLGSEACEGYTNENYMEYFAQNSNGLDVQLHTLCAAAFNYYAMYRNAIRMGYSEAEANITYAAFADAALVATDFYANAQ